MALQTLTLVAWMLYLTCAAEPIGPEVSVLDECWKEGAQCHLGLIQSKIGEISNTPHGGHLGLKKHVNPSAELASAPDGGHYGPVHGPPHGNILFEGPEGQVANPDSESHYGKPLSDGSSGLGGRGEDDNDDVGNSTDKKELLTNLISNEFGVMLDENHQNLCQRGKHLPELWVLGCQKCASTSFADDLMDAGYNTIHNLKKHHPHKKGDYHIFQEAYEHSGKMDREAFFAVLPECDLFQGTVASLSADTFHLTGQSDLYLEGFNEDKDKPNWKRNLDVPNLLHQFYGQPHIYRPVFVTLLREPLERFQSSYYFFSDERLPDYDPKVLGGTGCASVSNPDRVYTMFNNFAKCTLNQVETTGRHNSVLRPSLYGQHLGEWLKYVGPSQFIIMPAYAYINSNDGWRKACQSLSSRLNIALDCSKRQTAAHNKGEHPPLSKDLSVSVRKHFYHFLKPDHQKLLEQLVVIHQRGGLLVKFAAQANTGDVDAWLSKWWSSDAQSL